MFSFSRIREAVESGDNDEEFDNVDDDPNQEEDESCGCESRIGFDDGDINDFIEDVTESEVELMGYKVAQLKIKLAERGLIQTGRKPELVQRQPCCGRIAKLKHFSSDCFGINLPPSTFYLQKKHGNHQNGSRPIPKIGS